MVVGRLLEAELHEDLADMRLDRLEAQEQEPADRLIRVAFGDQTKNFAFALGEFRQRP